MPDSEFKWPAEYLKPLRGRNGIAVMNTPEALAKRPTRVGVPNGWPREYAEIAWAAAADKADKVMEEFEAAGLIEPALPDTDEAIAKAALREAVILALGPTKQTIKLGAINTCLAYTKMKPVSKAEINVKRPEDWLTEAIEASKDAAK